MTNVYIVYETAMDGSECVGDDAWHQYTSVDKVFDNESKAVEYIRNIIQQQIEYYTNRTMNQRRDFYQYEADWWVEYLSRQVSNIREDAIIEVGRRMMRNSTYYYKSYNVE